VKTLAVYSFFSSMPSSMNILSFDFPWTFQCVASSLGKKDWFRLVVGDTMAWSSLKVDNVSYHCTSIKHGL